jgi:hypothetical protein
MCADEIHLEGEQMVRFEKQQHTASGHITRRVLFALIATILVTPAALLAQQPAPTGAGAARALRSRTPRCLQIT